MPTNSSGNCDLRELAHLLRKERLLTNAEQENVEQLSSQVSSLYTALAQQAWISEQLRRNLQLLVLARQDCTTALQTQRGFSGNRLIFLEAGPVLGYPETSAYGEFLAALRNSPELIAECLNSGEKIQPDRAADVIHTLSSGLYGSCLLAEDKRLVLRLLRHLALLQLAPSDNPRRLLRHGTCAFARLYSTFHANLHTAQLFLTAALHGPIMTLLAEDEEFLEIDPEKSILRRGCEPLSEQIRHREWTVKRLVTLTQLFISGLRDHVFCFPPSVSWLLRQLVALLTKSALLHEKEIYELCTDLLLTHLICPAIVNPEPYGIIEAPVSRVARFNLMQVAQILQNLAVIKFEQCDVKLQDLYSQFNQDCVSQIMSSIMDGGSDSVEVPHGGGGDLEGVSRVTALLTASQLNTLVCFFQSVSTNDDESVNRPQLETLLANLPPAATNGHKDVSKPRPSDGGKKSGLNFSKAVRQKSQSNGDIADVGLEETVEAVLILRLPGGSDREDLLSEVKFLEMEGKVEPAPARCVVDGQDLPDSADTSQSQEKRTRFSMSHDEGSIGNTSDNLEAISEAASNHSEASSLESEGDDQNDNLSDMVSANVSGRGSPNISGRDTPSSQITEGEAPDGPAPVPHPVSKQSRSDIEDKFCKFEIKKQELLGDETVSLVSDTWSTDVLASDSETVGEVDRFPRPPDEGPPHPFIQHSLDISETASEAWSTDVMASDSERMTEVDTDDTASVARSDDTAASEPGGRGDEPSTPPPASFRPIVRPPRSEEGDPPRLSLAVPPSPTRSSEASYCNVTGRGGGKADYKRRTLEFVGAVSKPSDSLAALESPRMIHVIDKMDNNGRSIGSGRTSARPALRSPNPPLPPAAAESLEVGLAALSLANQNEEPPLTNHSEEALIVFDDATPPASVHSFKPSFPKFPDPKVKPETEDGVFRSSTSLASTSSSSSNAAAAVAPPLESKMASTGAIPKSISFDKTADKDFLDDKKQKKSFFGNFKMSFKNRKMKKGDADEGSLPRVRRVLSDDSRMPNGSIEVEDILAKYRGKAAEEPEMRNKRQPREVEEESYGLSEESIFLNAKRKLRIVFSRADLQSWPAAVIREKELVSFLQLQLAEARSLQNRDLVSQLHETLRCVLLFDADGCRRLVTALRTDYATRASYVAYLLRVRQVLLSRAALLTGLMDRLRVETRLTEAFLLALCVRLFLEKREDRFRRFSMEFRALDLADEKTDLLEAFLAEVATDMERDPAWQGASDEQLSEARNEVETAVLSRVYSYAFYPNGDGDISRDQVLHEHIKKLASIITPNHKALLIPQRYHVECPWPSAQAELTALASYKTPRDKVQCVTRCATTIMNLLALAGEGSIAAADEFLPVLIYVIIAANPPALLSTVQYVESFYTKLSGPDHYYWTNFSSAIIQIKNMDYNV